MADTDVDALAENLPAAQAALDEFDEHISELRALAHDLLIHQRPSHGPVELVRDGSEVRKLFPRLQASARSDVCILNRAPYYADFAAQAKAEPAMIRAGIRYKGIYGPEMLESEMFQHVRRWVAAGERARLLPEVPMKLAIFDDNCALLVVPEESESRTHLIVHPSGLLDGAIAMFDALWRVATPVPALAPASGPGAAQEDKEVLFLLAAGATDQVIARQLGVGERTAHRRVKALMDSLGASTRFQAGIQAARRGLL